LHSNSMKLKTATKTMQIAIGSYIPIFTLGITYGFYDGIYKPKTIKKAGLSTIGSIQNYCINQSG
jgi:hypothetical protein